MALFRSLAHSIASVSGDRELSPVPIGRVRRRLDEHQLVTLVMHPEYQIVRADDIAHML